MFGGASPFLLADAGEHMTLELYQNPQNPHLDRSNVSSIAVRLAFTVTDVVATKEKLIAKGGDSC